MHSLQRRLAFLAVAISMLALPASALATSTPEQIAKATKEGVKYLKTTQAENGSFPGFGGDWSLTSFAATGTAAADLHFKEEAGKTSARAFYGSETEYGSPTWPGTAGAAVTEFERAALVAYAAGIDPARTSPQQNLLAQIVAQYQTASPGYYGSTFNGTVFGLLAMTGAKTTAGVERFPQTLLNQSVEAIRANQHTDGGWTWEKAAGSEVALKRPSEPDLTGAAMAALCTAGVPKTNATIEKAKSYLVGILESNGAFKSEFGDNADSNSWAVEGLNACGINPQGAEFTSALGNTPIDYLISLQIPASGAFKYKTSETGLNQYSSQDAVRALAGAGFTAEPPTPSSGPRFIGATEWKAGKAAPLSLVVEYSTTIKVCSVSVTLAAGGSTTLATVLKDAETAATPTGCVTSFAPTEGSGAITQINKFPEPKATGWMVSIDGGSAEAAKRSTPIHLGDTIYLKFE
jgi:hypothetical protein